MQPSQAPPTPEQELAEARKALPQGRFLYAADRVGNALVADPHHREALDLLDHIIATAPCPMALAPLDGRPTTARLAVHAYVLAQKGCLPGALNLTLQAVAAHPQLGFLDWAIEWLKRPEAKSGIDMGLANWFMRRLLDHFQYGGGAGGRGKRTFDQIVPFIQAVRQTQKVTGPFLSSCSMLLRRLNRLDEAVDAANQAYEVDPCCATASAVGLAYEAKGELGPAVDGYINAIKHEPNNIPARLSLADMLWNHGRHEDAEHVYDAVLGLEQGHPWALPSTLFLKYRRTHDPKWHDALIRLARNQPDNDRACSLALRMAPFVFDLPEPSEAILNNARHLVREAEAKPDSPPPHVQSIASTSLEAPSAVMALNWQLRAFGQQEPVIPSVAKLQEPDPREPRAPVEYLLWKYDGLRPVPAVADPARRVASAVARLAAQVYDLKSWSEQAKGVAEQLGPGAVPDLLGAMVHPTEPPRGARIWSWVQRLQVAAALVLAHIDSGPWKGSLRRKVLFDLANGPMDWTVTAAVVALSAVAQEDPEAADDVVELYFEMLQSLPKGGPVCYHQPLLHSWLRLPNISADERDTLREHLRDLED